MPFWGDFTGFELRDVDDVFDSKLALQQDITEPPRYFLVRNPASHAPRSAGAWWGSGKGPSQPSISTPFGKTWFSMVNTSFFSRGPTSYPAKSGYWV